MVDRCRRLVLIWSDSWPQNVSTRFVPHVYWPICPESCGLRLGFPWTATSSVSLLYAILSTFCKFLTYANYSLHTRAAWSSSSSSQREIACYARPVQILSVKPFPRRHCSNWGACAPYIETHLSATAFLSTQLELVANAKAIGRFLSRCASHGGFWPRSMYRLPACSQAWLLTGIKRALSNVLEL